MFFEKPIPPNERGISPLVFTRYLQILTWKRCNERLVWSNAFNRSRKKKKERKKLGRSPWQKQRSSTLDHRCAVIHLSGRVCGADPLMHNFLRELESLMFPSKRINVYKKSLASNEKICIFNIIFFQNRDEQIQRLNRQNWIEFSERYNKLVDARSIKSNDLCNETLL